MCEKSLAAEAEPHRWQKSRSPMNFQVKKKRASKLILWFNKIHLQSIVYLILGTYVLSRSNSLNLISLNLTSFPLLFILFAPSSFSSFSLGLHKQNILYYIHLQRARYVLFTWDNGCRQPYTKIITYTNIFHLNYKPHIIYLPNTKTN